MRMHVLKFALVAAASLPAAPAAAQQPAPPDPARAGAAVDEHMRRLVPFGFSGVLLVVRDGQTLVRGGYGMADVESGRPFTPETPFYIGSLTKQFTAAAILTLQSQGRLEVTDSIGRFLDGVPDDKRGITLHHLLTHTAGLAADPPAGLEAVRDRDGAVRDILGASLRAAPGSGYTYSNAGYTLLAAVVEHVAGMPYEQYLRDALWTPAGMTHTGYRPAGMEAVAVGYADGERRGTPMDHHVFADGPSWNMRGAGGMLSTLDDLLAWSRALDGDAVLSAEARARLWTPHVPTGPGGREHYGYGWVIARTSRGTGVVWHNGSNGVYYAEMRRYPDERTLVIAAGNVAEASAERALNGATRLTFGLPYTLAPAALDADPARAAEAAGTYRLPEGGTITVRADQGRLRLRGDGADAYAAIRGSAPSAEAEQAGARTMAVLDAAGRGEFEPMHQAAGGRIPVEALRRMYQDNLDAEGVGAAVSLEHVGTLARPRGALSNVRIHGDRGTLLLAVSWEGERITGMESVHDTQAPIFVPAPEGGWVSYDLNYGTTVRLRITDGELEVDTPAGPIRAVRP